VFDVVRIDSWLQLTRRVVGFGADELLDLQRRFVLSRRTSLTKSGFLISGFSLGELEGLFQRQTRLYCLRWEGQLRGYVLVTEIAEFQSYFASPEDGFFHGEQPLKWDDLDYLYQICVDHRCHRTGQGSQLLRAVRAKESRNLLTDVLVEPLRNGPSIDFFRKNGFSLCGTLELLRYRDFGPLQSVVFVQTTGETPSADRRLKEQ
jgi:ribosomal protein S18 acetylase RimI-like enzyme